MRENGNIAVLSEKSCEPGRKLAGERKVAREFSIRDLPEIGCRE